MAHSHNEHRPQEEFLHGLHSRGALGRRTVVHISPAATRRRHVTRENELTGVTLPTYKERRVVLSDGTQVVVENEQEYMVTGPEGISIVLNCLPLYCMPRNETMQRSSSESDNEGEPVCPITQTQTPSNVQEVDLNSTSTVTDATNGPLPRCNSDGSSRQKWEEFDECDTSPVSAPGTMSLPVKVADSVGEPSDFPQAFNAFEDNFSPAAPSHNQPNDVFLTVDPFATELPNPLETQFNFSGMYNSVEGKKWDLSDSDDESTLEDVDFQVKYVDSVSSVTQRSAAVTFTNSQGVRPTPPQLSLNSEGLYATPLPPPPMTVFPRYAERCGWLSKLSHRKGVFGDKWQKRYVVLDGCNLRYYKKMGDPVPKGVIKLIPRSWCKRIVPGTERMADATVNQSKTSLISVNHCFAVHRPHNHAASISRLLSSEGVTEAFNSQSVAFVDSQDTSRTFYLVASTDQERDAWVEAIEGNIYAYVHSPAALQSACSELGIMLRAVGCSVSDSDLPSVLLLLYKQTETIMERQRSFCKAHQQNR